MSCNLSKT
jgi:hypothetical protein